MLSLQKMHLKMASVNWQQFCSVFNVPNSCFLFFPPGLVYLLMKHMVDRYNICFAYTPSKIDQKIHASAVNFVIIAVIFLQCTVVFFNILRTGKGPDFGVCHDDLYSACWYIWRDKYLLPQEEDKHWMPVIAYITLVRNMKASQLL